MEINPLRKDGDGKEKKERNTFCGETTCDSLSERWNTLWLFLDICIIVIAGGKWCLLSNENESTEQTSIVLEVGRNRYGPYLYHKTHYDLFKMIRLNYKIKSQ